LEKNVCPLILVESGTTLAHNRKERLQLMINEVKIAAPTPVTKK
jgi:hypothetical protein